mgnify:CR=1 FL=1
MKTCVPPCFAGGRWKNTADYDSLTWAALSERGGYRAALKTASKAPGEKKHAGNQFEALIYASAPVNLLSMGRTLVLNRSFRAVAVADWQRAVTLI